MGYYTRKHWTSTANRAVHVKRKQVHATLHYPGWGTDSIRTAGWSRKRCFQQLRAWRNMHVGSGAYKEVAYNLYALPTGDVAEGRGNRQNGANGTSAANRAGMSIQVLIGDNEDLTMGHLRAIFDALALLERWHPGITSRQYGHRHWVSTRCPGPKVQARVPFRVGSVPTDGGGKGITGTAPGLSDGLADVDDSQRWLTALGYDPGPIDGKFGARTQAATRQAQLDLGITPADGRPGPATRATLEAAVTTLDKISKDIAAIKRTLEPGISGKRTDGELVSTLRGFRNDIPGMVLDAPVALEGKWKGQKSTLRRMRAWYAEDLRQIKAGIATSRAAVLEAVQETGKAQGLTDAQVQAIATAAAEASARVSAEDVAGQLEVAVRNED
ncbi:peptidoglycan-binding domain-containing protein [Brachybacterium massiliense]|uniref:peptidoglycan-binding domain-containing protein n=1 Tax=Brachybacterium massiliense TaxID=1755098 RepID=UPI000B3BC4DB|nr:peptidoglycan-binding domain-containing protein [Brachybacterium massiliense]